MSEEDRHARVLVVEDDETARNVVASALAEEGYDVQHAGSGEEALKVLSHDLFDVVLLDLHLPGMQGLNVLTAASSLQTDAQFIVMTAYSSVDGAVEAMRLGAYDYLRKPFGINELLVTIERARAETEMRREVARLRSHVATDLRSRIIGRSPAMNRMFDLIARVAPMRATVLITGETGTGKELVARAVHELSDRARKSFVAVNCSALPETLLESELFGHVKGSFTGAIASRRGLFEEAGGGTLFLDEVSTISQHIQVKLLRVLEERVVHRVGSTQPVRVDFRLVAATNRDLESMVAEGSFREDLHYRLNVFPIRVPALRERRADIPLLANHFRLRFAQENDIEPPTIPAATLDRMMAYEWPGNVRELENFIERAMIMYAGAREIRFEPQGAAHRVEKELVRKAAEAEWDLDRLEREYIMAVLERSGGHRSRTAQVLGIDRRTLYRKLRRMSESRRRGGEPSRN